MMFFTKRSRWPGHMRFGLLIGLVLAGGTARGSSIFEKNPDRNTKSYPTFSVGVTGLQVKIQKGLVLTVQGAIPGSPAEGRFRKGQVVTGVNGHSFREEDDVLVLLGEALGAAEATDGRMTFAIQDGSPVTVRIPVLGPYGENWPLHCGKSQRIIEQTRTYILSGDLLKGDGIPNMLAGLFMMSTGKQTDLDAVMPMIRRIADRPVVGGGSNWPRGYQGILLGEYYLRTGDASVLPGVQKLCDGTEASQYLGGWAHGGLAVNQDMGYVQGGLMNPAGAPILTALILAQECGVRVKPRVFESSLRFFWRFAGHGAVPYGDHRPEGWMSCNGKNGMLAAGLHLLGQEPYPQAGRHLSLDMADSYRWLRAGHTGGGFDVMWRSLTAHNVPDNRTAQYRSCLKHLAWYYDLSRLPGGGFSMVGEGRYGGTAWGTGSMALLYTAPLRTLRITGMAPTAHSRKVHLPVRPWGNQADEVFLSTAFCEGYGPDTLEIHELFAGIEEGKTDVCVKALRHYSPVIRMHAAKALAEQQAIPELLAGLRHPDPRVRRAVCEGISNDGGFFRGLDGRSRSALKPEQVSEAFLPYVLSTLEKSRTPGAVALWETDGALYALSKARPEDIRANLGLITPWLKHEDWFLRESAFYAMQGLREQITMDELFSMAEVFAQEPHSKAQMNYAGAFRYLFQRLGVKLNDRDLRIFAQTVARQMTDPQVPENLGVPAKQQCAFKAAMLLNGMDEGVYLSLPETYARYLKDWTPDTQHSVWMVTGSRWTKPMSKVLTAAGAEGRVLCQAMKATLARFESGELTIPSGDPGTGGAHKRIVPELQNAVDSWEATYGTVKAGFPDGKGL